MMTQQQKERQKKLLNAVKWPEWRKAIDELTLKISCLLHGHIEEDELGVKHVVGGYTQYGAHSAYERGGEALYDYESTIVSKLINCECEWKEGLSLSDQLKEIASHVIDDKVQKYLRKKAREDRTGIHTKPISLDVGWMGREDDYTGYVTDMIVAVRPDTSSKDENEDDAAEQETPTDKDSELITSLVFGVSSKAEEEELWEIMYEAAQGDQELEWFLKMHEPTSSQEVEEDAKHMTSRERDRLVKKLRRRVNSKIKDNGKKENRQHTKC